MPWLRALGRRWVVAVLLLLATPCAADPSPVVRANQVVSAFVNGWIARHPERATRLGDHDHDGILPLRSPAALERDAAWLVSQRDSLRAIPLAALPPATSIDVRLALGRAELEARKATVERLGARDPSEALRELHVALADIIYGAYASPCGRTVRLRERLRAVPEFLRNVRLDQTDPERVCVEYALDQVAALLRMCREDVAVEFEGCRESSLQADLAVADSVATHALSRYADELRHDVLPEAKPGWPVDSTGLRMRLERVAGGPVDLAAVLDRARYEWDQQSSALTRESGVPLDEFQRIDADSAESMLKTMRRRLVRDRQFPEDPYPRIRFSDAPVTGRGPAIVVNGPWGGRPARARFRLGPRNGEGADPGAGALQEDPMFSFDGARLLLARDGIPGRAMLLAAEARWASRDRQALGLEAVRDGWARYSEYAWVDHLPGPQREVSVRRVYRLERERLARTIAELMLRLESASVEDAARWLERGATLSPEAAHAAALEAACHPHWAASTVAYWMLLDLRHAAEDGSPAFDAAAFHAALLREGAVPTTWVANLAISAAGARGSK